MPVEYDRQSLQPNRVSFIHPSHTPHKSNCFVQSRLDSATTHKESFKVVLGDVDINGNPRARNTIVTVSVEHPVENDAALIATAKTRISALLSDTTVQQDAERGLLINSATYTSSEVA